MYTSHLLLLKRFQILLKAKNSLFRGIATKEVTKVRYSVCYSQC